MALFNKKTKKETVAQTEVATQEVAKKVSVGPIGGHAVRSVLVRPHASEKAYGLHGVNTYVFYVNKNANKTLVKEEITRRYNVKVVRVNMITDHGKIKHYRGHETKAKVAKKAMVTLKKGDKIEIV
ncbi:MAG: 50S ribosomal protein L23 [Candidatus Paceibacterota bacterium]|jgi:large subunit ribosomal protein L23